MAASDQIRQMVNFILQEAHEKANEIRVKVCLSRLPNRLFWWKLVERRSRRQYDTTTICEEIWCQHRVCFAKKKMLSNL